MPDRSIIFRLTSETSKLYDEYREKYVPKQASDSQIIRAGLAVMMAIPDAVINDEMDKLQKVNDQILVEMKKIIKKHPEPRLYELWIKLIENTNKMVALFEKYYKTSVSQEPAFEEINDIYPTFVSQGFDRDHPDFAAYQQEQVQIAISFLKEHFPEYASESFEEINNIYSYEYSEQNEQDSVIKKHNINEEIKKAQQTIQEYYKSSY